MQAEPTTRLDCLTVVTDEALFLRVQEVLTAWRLAFERADEVRVFPLVEQGVCRIVVIDRRPSFRLFLERIKAAGGVAVVLGAMGPDVPSDVECVVRPSELVAALFRAQGRLMGVETNSAHRVSQFAQVIAEQFTLPELVEVAITKTRELCEAEGASLLLVEPSTGGLSFDTVSGAGSSAIERVQLPKGRGIAGKVAIEGRPKLVIDAQKHPDFDVSADRESGYSTGSIVAAPLVLGGDVLGVLMAVRSSGQIPFAPVHLERLVSLAPHVAIAVHNAQITTALRTSQSQVIEANVDLEKKIKERTQQISRAKQEWERTFDAIDAPIALLDGYVIRRSNMAYARKVGMPIRDIPGRTCHKVFANRDTPCPGCPLAEGRGQSLAGSVETVDRRNNKSSFWRFHGYRLSEELRDPAVVVTYHDETQSHELAGKLRESERLAAVGQLASGAAHEINNPLGFVTSNLRSLRGLFDEMRAPINVLSDAMLLLKEQRFDDLHALLESLTEPDPQSLDDGLEMIDESLDGARRVGDIVKGLRELSRLEIGKREPSNVNASVTRIVRSELGDAPNVVVQLEAEALADIPPLQLDQVLGHVLRNARQATAKKEAITVRTLVADGFVQIQVRDEGAGIARENQRRVFEPFFSTRGVGKGIGLGLTAAYGIVKRTGGDIEAFSDGPGKGALFTIRLPMAEMVDFADVA